MSNETIAITGAAGFIGRHVVKLATELGYNVHCIVRSETSIWSEYKNVKVFVIDIEDKRNQKLIDESINDVNSVIHLAGAYSGDPDQQISETVSMTKNIIKALEKSPKTFVLVSSISVYMYHVLPKNSMIDEETPIERKPTQRDAYCQGKLMQEALVCEFAKPAWILRPGAVFGPDRIWNAHLGIRLGPIAVIFNGSNTIPVSWVEHTSLACILAATKVPDKIEAINVLDDDLPSQRQYIDIHSTKNWPKYTLYTPLWILSLIEFLLNIIPFISNKIPNLMRREARAARLHPFNFSNRKLKERLGWQPVLPFYKAMTQSIEQSSTGQIK